MRAKAPRIWPYAALTAVFAGVLILAAPAKWEGPVLMPISPGHALSLLDTLALVPLLFGTGWLYWGLWQRRDRLARWIHQSLGSAAVAIFVAGLGLGLLLASAFSTFWWWWAVGAGLFGLVLVGTVIILADR